MTYVVICKTNTLPMNIISGSVISGVISDPGLAIATARQLMNDNEESPYIFHIYIFQIEENVEIKPSVFLTINENGLPESAVYHSYQLKGDVPWQEKFYGTFKLLNRKSVDRNNVWADSGKFKAVVMFDSDCYKQIDEDVDSREEAYELAVSVAGHTLPFAVYDDQGICQTRNGKLIELVS